MAGGVEGEAVTDARGLGLQSRAFGQRLSAEVGEADVIALCEPPRRHIIQHSRKGVDADHGLGGLAGLGRRCRDRNQNREQPLPAGVAERGSIHRFMQGGHQTQAVVQGGHQARWQGRAGVGGMGASGF